MYCMGVSAEISKAMTAFQCTNLWESVFFSDITIKKKSPFLYLQRLLAFTVLQACVEIFFKLWYFHRLMHWNLHNVRLNECF